jgi:hydrogenase maturation protein HypF
MARIHAEAEINGIVQGVGFRPFIHKRVAEFDLSGEIRNTPFGVSLSLEGERERVEKFLDTLKESAPPLAAIYEIKKSYSEELSGTVIDGIRKN